MADRIHRDWNKHIGVADEVVSPFPSKTKADASDSPPRGQFHGRLQVFSVADLDTATPRDYLLKGLISPGEISIWVGPPKCGKSFLLLYVAYMLSLGISIFGHRVKPTKVLYVAAEGEAGIANRIRALRDKFGWSDNFHFVAQPIDLLRDDGHKDDVIKAGKELGSELIVVDTLNRAIAGGDENSSQDMGTLVRNISEIKTDTKAHIAVIHHGTKGSNGSRPRGHSSLEGADDALVEVLKQEDGTNLATVVHAKDDPDGMRWGFALDVVELGIDEDGDPITTLIVRELNQPSAKPADAEPGVKLNPESVTLLREIENMVGAQQHRMGSPEPGMPICAIVGRPLLQVVLIKCGWLQMPAKNAVSIPVSNQSSGLKPGVSKVSGPSFHLETGMETPSKAEQSRLWKRLNELKLKGKIGFNRDDAWLARMVYD